MQKQRRKHPLDIFKAPNSFPIQPPEPCEINMILLAAMSVPWESYRFMRVSNC